MVKGKYDVNDAGDFDQLSIAGVDFGENYDEVHNIKPNYLQGESFMYGADYQQLGADYDQLGIVPTGMGEDYQQLGIVPTGMGHGMYKQLGEIPYGLGADYQQLGQFEALTKKVKLPLVNMEVPMWGMLLGGFAAFYMINRQMKWVKLPF